MRVLCLFLVCAASLSGCVSAATRESRHAQHSIHQLVPYNIFERRPAVLGADPNVGPGGTDFQSTILPNEHFDCEPLSNLYREFPIAKLRTCAASLKKEVDVLYRLKRKPAPFLELETTQETPDCLKQALPEIPLPREIFFQSTEEGLLSCYSSRLDIEADELLWVKVPRAKTALKLSFPSAIQPGPRQEAGLSDDELRLVFLSWIIAPFRDVGGRIVSTVVPDDLCRRCMGEKNMLQPGGAPIVLWP